jgi:HTH-type transcriptional regulator, sugar sensing transcriptional regulator
MDLEDALAQIGISGKPARFYLAALEFGQAPVHELAEKAGISRTTAYDVLARLARDGLVSRLEKDGRYHVAVEDPARLVGVLDDRRRMVEALLPELRSRYNRSGVKPRIRFYEGRDGINAVLHDTLECRSKRLYGILSMRDLLEVPGKGEMEKYIAQRIARGIHLRVVRSQEKEAGRALWPTSARELRELRYAPGGAVFTMTTWTYDEKVSIISSRREHFGMIIESPEFSALMTNLFAVLWDVSTPT